MTCPRRHTALKIVMSLGLLGAIVSQAAAQQPTKGQANALRSACRNDFMAHCSNVKPSGPAALTCLQRNAASLSSACRTAVSAVGAGSAPARAAPGPAAPAATVPAPPAPTNAAVQQPTKGQANALRSACRKDFMAHCSNVNPSGPAALTCLQRNVASLSSACRTAVSAVGADSAPARAAPGPAAPAAAVPAPPAPTNAAVQQPTKGQTNALRSACRKDFMAHCSNVNPSGPAALTCLQRNVASLSSACRTAVTAVGADSAAARAQPTALPTPALTQDTNVAFVEAVSGRVVVFAHGKPDLLANSDTITDRAQLDLQANSELRICHYRANRLLTLRGPSRAFVSADSVTDESGRAVSGTVGTCTPPGVSR